MYCIDCFQALGHRLMQLVLVEAPGLVCQGLLHQVQEARQMTQSQFMHCLVQDERHQERLLHLEQQEIQPTLQQQTLRQGRNTHTVTQTVNFCIVEFYNNFFYLYVLATKCLNTQKQSHLWTCVARALSISKQINKTQINRFCKMKVPLLHNNKPEFITRQKQSVNVIFNNISKFVKNRIKRYRVSVCLFFCKTKQTPITL